MGAAPAFFSDGGPAAARVGANAPAEGAGGRRPGPLCAPGGTNPIRRNMFENGMFPFHGSYGAGIVKVELKHEKGSRVRTTPQRIA